ncbi:MAG TPA: aminotransferase class III-fold pyridoxal phosphate-dependent enzyme [Candidatus Hydrogenedentes bacterium]|nr:aminotransferase class III-fold pyridoxal phosphate-dependent enzyme [Candidatus Hydrogenedentota bacterium]
MSASTSPLQASPGLPQGRLERLRALGHDFLEGRREGAYLWDMQGHRYLDAVSGAGTHNLGRRPEAPVAALRNALRDTDQGNFPMVSIEKARLAETLAGFVPGPLECAVFSVMRGEAMDCACKVARGRTGRAELVTVDGGWYGQTGFALTLSERADKTCFGPLIPEVRIVPFDDISAAEQAVTARTAAFILEPLQAENNCRAAMPEYAGAVAQLCRDRGALLVVDETQTNFGRTGHRFAFEALGMSPDILVLGEALGAGVFPIAATLLTQDVNRFLNAHPLIHLSTFGGSDIGCRVALSAVETYARLEPWRNASMVGARLLADLRETAERPGSPIRGVAGAGLLLSLDCGTEEAAAALCRRAADQGLLVLPGAVARHTVVLRPSLLITEDEADAIVTAVRACL